MKETIVAVLLAGAVSAGCGLNDSDRYAEPLEGRILVSLTRQRSFGATPEGVHLHLETEKEYPCANYLIGVNHLERHENYPLFHLTDAYLPWRICLHAFGPATARLTLTDGSCFAGIIALQFKGRVDTYRVRADADSLHIQPIATSFSELGEPAP